MFLARPPDDVIAPTIKLVARHLVEGITLMLDTGASKNVIKERCVSPDVIINRDEILRLRGITENTLLTLGYLRMELLGIESIFHIVPDDFPIDQSGILSSEYFRQTGARIDYASHCLVVQREGIPFHTGEVMTIPPCSTKLSFARVMNSEVSHGYLPPFRASEGLIVQGGHVNNLGGKAYFIVTNTRDHAVDVAIPSLTLLTHSPSAVAIDSCEQEPVIGSKNGESREIVAGPSATTEPRESTREIKSVMRFV